MPVSHGEVLYDTQKVPGERPSTTGTSEALPTSEQWLLDIISLPQEITNELSEKWHEITDRALTTTVNPHDRQALAITARIVEWRLFGQPGDPLPVGLVQQDTEEGIRLVYDTRLDVGRYCVEDSLQKLNTLGLNEINETLKIHVKERSSEIKEIIKRSVEDSRAFQFISTLAEGELPQQDRKQPLSPFWRMVRENQVTQMVRERWSIEPHESILPRTTPDFDLRRELRRLDDETMLSQTEQGQQEPLSRLYSYLEQFIRVATKEEIKETFVGFGVDEDGDKVISTTQYPEGHCSERVLQRAAHNLTSQIVEVAPHIQVMTEIYVYYLMGKVLWPKAGADTQDFAQLSNEAITDSYWLKDEIISCRRLESSDYTGSRKDGARIYASLAEPTGGYIGDLQLGDTWNYHDHFFNNEARAEISSHPDTNIGEVLSYSPYTKGQHAHRLIQLQHSTQPLLPLSGREELSIRLSGKRSRGSYPYIPGYRLVSNSRDVFGFVPDNNGDPYVSADVPLSITQRDALVSNYKDLGLSQLSEAVERQAWLTVQDLASLIKKHTTYPSTKQATRPPLSGYVYLSEIKDFSELVRNGNLHVQCTGAAQFLRFSLEEVFGKGSAATTSGYKISRRNISTNAMHSQTVFTYEGETYILDATPSSNGSNQNYNDYLFDGMSTRFKRFFARSRATMKIIDIALENIDHRPELEQSAPPGQTIEAIRRSFDTQLVGLLQVPDKESAYAAVNRLPEHDPFKRTLSGIISALRGETTQDDAEALLRYLQSYEQASESVRREMKVQSYDASTVDLLVGVAEQLVTLFEV